jgi:hypothetical protein
VNTTGPPVAGTAVAAGAAATLAAGLVGSRAEEGDQADCEDQRGKGAEPCQPGRGQLGRIARFHPRSHRRAPGIAVRQFDPDGFGDRLRVQPHRLGKGSRKADRIGARRQGGKIAGLDHFEMAQRNARLAGDTCQFDPPRLARRPQPCANPGIGHALRRFGTDILFAVHDPGPRLLMRLFVKECVNCA